MKINYKVGLNLLRCASKVSEQLMVEFVTLAKKEVEDLENLTIEEHHFFYIQFLSFFIKDNLFKYESFTQMISGYNIYPHKNTFEHLVENTLVIFKTCKDELEEIKKSSGEFRY